MIYAIQNLNPSTIKILSPTIQIHKSTTLILNPPIQFLNSMYSLIIRSKKTWNPPPSFFILHI